MKTFKEMTKEELRKEAATRGIKNYIIMPTMKLAEALEEDERRKQSVVDQLGQDAKTKAERVIEFYDRLAEYGACDLYAKVDSIVDGREITDLEDSELDEILTLEEGFDLSKFKKATVKEEKEEKKVSEEEKEESPETPSEKKSVASKRNGVVALSNPILPQIKKLLAEGKKNAEIAKILGKSSVYIYKCVKAIKSENE
jgi:hypothetical protein